MFRTMVWFVFIMTTVIPALILAQQAPQDPQAAKPVNCLKPASDRERYQCFIQRRQSVQSRLATEQEKRVSIEEQARRIRKQRRQEEDRVRQRERAEIDEMVRISRSRNVSNAGKPYDITFGRVSEPRERLPKGFDRY